MKNLFYLLILLNVLFAKAQDVISTTSGDITISPILHGTLVLEWNDLTVYVDPYGGAELFASFKPADLILITDIHGDHLNQKTLDGLNTEGTLFIVPAAVAEKLPETYQSQILSNDETTNWRGINIAAIPMYNLPEEADSRHPKGRGNGYILTIGDKKIYISGDTEDISEMRDLVGIDVAFVCMNLPYTMSVEQAADAVCAFKPAIVYPYHYRGSEGLSDINQFKSLVNSKLTQVDVRLREWYKN